MKYITVPLDDAAAKKLIYDEAESYELIELIFVQNELDELFSIGFFNRLNKILDINIDDFEDEAITDMRKLIIFRNFLKDWIKEHPDDVYQQLLKLVSVAIEKETGIFFFF